MSGISGIQKHGIFVYFSSSGAHEANYSLNAHSKRRLLVSFNRRKSSDSLLHMLSDFLGQPDEL
ncbi:hypothetical protein PsorP6_007003 [Peronosclerospora sorghi]|uniref:Uncharacterized protein n=1 Tax=Peronosclerospora sorghi TaxID=230839 RepID=A0ACC0WB82_9STRA|nr:hypothetical protein PsorP6_007003 [Peronosclerospora sorghi]